jgi:hypothetical protein
MDMLILFLAGLVLGIGVLTYDEVVLDRKHLDGLVHKL